MKIITIFFSIYLASLPVFAGDVPPITAVDFGGSTVDAHWVWSMLAGIGSSGAIFYALLRVVWKFAKPYLDTWVATKRLGTLYQFAQTAVSSTMQTYVSEIRAASADGKLTQEEKAIALGNARSVFIALCKTQGIDVVKEYGLQFIDWLLEKFVGDSKEVAAIAPFSAPQLAPTAKAVQAIPEPPLPDL